MAQGVDDFGGAKGGIDPAHGPLQVSAAKGGVAFPAALDEVILEQLAGALVLLLDVAVERDGERDLFVVRQGFAQIRQREEDGVIEDFGHEQGRDAGGLFIGPLVGGSAGEGAAEAVIGGALLDDLFAHAHGADPGGLGAPALLAAGLDHGLELA